MAGVRSDPRKRLEQQIKSFLVFEPSDGNYAPTEVRTAPSTLRNRTGIGDDDRRASQSGGQSCRAWGVCITIAAARRARTLHVGSQTGFAFCRKGLFLSEITDGFQGRNMQGGQARSSASGKTRRRRPQLHMRFLSHRRYSHSRTGDLLSKSTFRGLQPNLGRIGKVGGSRPVEAEHEDLVATTNAVTRQKIDDLLCSPGSEPQTERT